MPEISVIMPVFNTGIHVAETLKSIQNQTFQNYEVICVQADSCEDVDSLLRDMAAEDHRFRVVPQIHAGMGGARNDGLSWAAGRYTIFLEEAVVWEPALLETLWNGAEQAQADAAVCDFLRMERNGKPYCKPGLQGGWLPKGTTVFSYRNCPHRIMNIWRSEPWNKLYRRDFLRKHSLAFEETASQYDTAFAAVSAAAAEQIVYIPEQLMRYWVGQGSVHPSKQENLRNLPIAMASTIRQGNKLAHRELIQSGLCFFVIQAYLYAAKNSIADFASPEAKAFYTEAHAAFSNPIFDGLTPRLLQNQDLFWEFYTVRKHDYETMGTLLGRKLIVSLTSFPGRIHSLPQVLETLYAQTRPADQIVLWLAEEQFLHKEDDLPSELRQLAGEHRLEIRWCRDLKSHKKYFYALQEFTEALVVTVDDDLLYPRDMLEKLHKSYLAYPEAVSAMRVHLMRFDEHQRLLPYNRWIMETDACIHEPSMQLFATSGAGVLYPPKLFHPAFFDEAVIARTCMWADDLWLKAMQAVSDVPVVAASEYQPLQYLPSSKIGALNRINVDENQNDVQLSSIVQWLNQRFEGYILEQKLTEAGGIRIVEEAAVISHLNQERQKLRTGLWREKRRGEAEIEGLRNKQRLLQQEIQDSHRQFREKERLLAEETQQKQQLQQRERTLLQEQEQLRQRLAELQRLIEQKHQEQQTLIAEQNRLIAQVAALEGNLNDPKELLNRIMQSWKRRSISLLAWLPCRYLNFLRCVQDYGLRHTLRHGLAKVGRKLLGKRRKP